MQSATLGITAMLMQECIMAQLDNLSEQDILKDLQNNQPLTKLTVLTQLYPASCPYLW